MSTVTEKIQKRKLRNKVLIHKIVMHFMCSNSVSQRSNNKKKGCFNKHKYKNVSTRI